jgi:signal-transduction protein with cAMP-binding, CBS, and nucleotidyltransferase domain
VEISDENGPVCSLGRGHHFGERELLRKLKRQFNATALESTTLLTLDRATFDALAQNSLTLGYLLSRSSVQYLTLDERRGIVNQISPEIRQKRVADFMRTNPTVIRETDSVKSALKIFKTASASMLPVVNQRQLCKGWLRLDFVFDLLHQGRVRADSTVCDLLILPSIAAKPNEPIDEVLLRFAQTADREFAVEDDAGQLIGTLALLDLVLMHV